MANDQQKHPGIGWMPEFRPMNVVKRHSLAMHPGIDFLGPTGYPVRATAGGTVIAADNAGGYGNMVEIDHGNGVTTRYGHLSQILVKVGQIVPKDAIIGRIGSTGRSTGPHLHLESRSASGQPFNPLLVFDR